MPNLVSKVIDRMSQNNQTTFFLALYITLPMWILFLYNGNIAIYNGEQIIIDLEILVLKNNFVKFLVICLDLIVSYIAYKYIENRILRFKIEFKRKKEMEKLVKQFPQCLYWVNEMTNNTLWGNTRFKKIENGYPKFVMYPHLYDIESVDNFITPEINRIPLFIGSQFGISPKLEELFKSYDENIKIAILNKSLLSGAVAGLKIYLLKKNYELEEIIFFKNEK